MHRQPPPSGAEARGKVRAFRAECAGIGTRINCWVDRPSTLDEALAMRRRGSEVGRRRAEVRLRARFAGAFGWVRSDRGSYAAFLDSVDEPIILTPTDVGQVQPAVLVRYVAVATPDYPASSGLWSLEVPDHALMRAAERDPRGDLGEKVRSAHRSLLAGRQDEPSLSGEFLVPTSGPGVFVVEWLTAQDRSSGHEVITYARARTWLHLDQLRDDQRQPTLVPAREGEMALRDGYLLPSPLRPPIYMEGNRIVTGRRSRWW